MTVALDGSELLPSLLALAAAVQFAVGSLLVKAGLAHTERGRGATISIAASTVAHWLAAPWLMHAADWASPAILVFAAIGLVRPVISTNLAYEGTHRLGPTISSTVASVSPLFAVTGGVLLLGEALTWPVIVGSLGVVGGIMALTARGGARRDWPLWALLLPIGAAMIRSTAHVGGRYGLGILASPYMAGLVAYSVSLLVALAATGVGARLRPRAPLGAGTAVTRVTLRGARFFILAGLANAGAILALNSALLHGPVVRVSPVAASAPIFTLLFSALIYRAEAITWRTVAAVSLVVPGVMLIALMR